MFSVYSIRVFEIGGSYTGSRCIPLELCFLIFSLNFDGLFPFFALTFDGLLSFFYFDF